MKKYICYMAIACMLCGCSNSFDSDNKETTTEATIIEATTIEETTTHTTTIANSVVSKKEEEQKEKERRNQELKKEQQKLELERMKQEQNSYQNSNYDNYDTNDEYQNISNLLYSYCDAMCNSVSLGDYSIVSNYILNGSALDTMQKSFVAKQSAKGTKENFVSLDINTINIDIDNNSATIYTKEKEDIYYSNGKSEIAKSFSWKYTAVKSGGIWYLTNLEKW